MLSLFFGSSGGDVHAWLSKFSDSDGFQLEMVQLGADSASPNDLRTQAPWDRICFELASGRWDVLLMSPPSSTFSRAHYRHNGRNGPRPLRDVNYPWGFPWLRNADKDRVSEENFLLKQCLRAAAAQNQAGLFWLFIHPEDLGLAASGLRPASVWQLSEMRALIPEDGCSFALHLCIFGAATAAPTRIAGHLPSWKHLRVQWPSFDPGGYYLGPLQRCLLHDHASSVGWDGQTWRTVTTFPDAFSEFVARASSSMSSQTFATDTLALPELPHAAESYALELLAHSEVSAQELATLYHLLPHESPHVGAQADSGSAFFTGAYTHGGVVGLRSNTSAFPHATKVIVRFLHRACETFEFFIMCSFLQRGYKAASGRSECQQHKLGGSGVVFYRRGHLVRGP